MLATQAGVWAREATRGHVGPRAGQALARLPPAARHAEATELMRTARQSLDRSHIAVLLESEFHASDVWNLQQSMVGASRDYLGNLLEEGEKPGSVSDDAQEAIIDRIYDRRSAPINVPAKVHGADDLFRQAWRVPF